MNDKEMFEAATAPDEPEVEAVAEHVAPEPAQDNGPARDEHGRFAARQAEPEAQPEPEAAQAQQQAKEEATVPSWRLREVNEAREAAERRAAEIEAHYRRQFAELQARIPKPEPKPAPDVFENPNAFLEHGVNQAVDPIKNELNQTREFFSQQLAMRDHGPEKVQAAYKWIEQGLASRDPEAIATYQRAMQSMHPYDALVRSHQQREVYQQIGGDPQAWAQKWLAEQLADPAKAGAILQQIQQRSSPQSQDGRPVTRLPPSLNRMASAASASDNPIDNSEAGIFAYATSR